MTATVEAIGLTQTYGRQAVVSDVDLALGEGIYGLLGPNGAGKTTLLRLLATAAPPTSGQLNIGGRAVRTVDDARSARRQIGYLPQQFGYAPGFTVYEFVRYCGWLREVPADRLHDATMEAIGAVDLTACVRTTMRRLSGGMLRRCGIAQALVGSPRVLLLDEPTVGLDPARRLEFRELLRSRRGTTVVLSTHLVEDVAATCDEVLVLDGGRLRFRGRPDELAAAATPDARGDTALERGYTTVLADRAVAA